MTTSVDTLATKFEQNILSSFTTETLELAAQEIVDVSSFYLLLLLDAVAAYTIS